MAVYAEKPAQTEEKTEPSFQDYLEQGAKTATKPLRTGEAAHTFTTKIGRANINLSLVHGLKLTVDDSEFTFNLGGRILIDATHYFEDKNDLGDNGLGIRSIRTDMYGQFNRNWQYMFSLGGFTSGGRIDTSGVSIDNLYIRYRGFEDYVVTAGQHTEPFSLEELTSRLNITFMERALNNAFAPGATVGLSVVTGKKWWTARAGFFGNSFATQKDQGNQGYGITGNFSGAPIHTGGNILHLGGSYSYRNVESVSDVFFRSRPESGLTDVRYVNTGTIIESESLHRFGLESIWISGPWSIQGEYIHTLVGRKEGFTDLHLSGWYAFLSWFPTGETRNYQRGKIVHVEPVRDFGAVELAVRYSSIDLTSADVLGGRENDVTVGVNWYVNPYLRVMFNYIYVMTDSNANDDNTVIGNDSPHILQARFQWQF